VCSCIFEWELDDDAGMTGTFVSVVIKVVVAVETWAAVTLAPGAVPAARLADNPPVLKSVAWPTSVPFCPPIASRQTLKVSCSSGDSEIVNGTASVTPAADNVTVALVEIFQITVEPNSTRSLGLIRSNVKLAIGVSTFIGKTKRGGAGVPVGDGIGTRFGGFSVKS